ncbi:MAG: hypothetical protein R3E56_04810 [Burkholderiaceae bacterium]
MKVGDVVAVLQPVAPQLIDAHPPDACRARGQANAARQAAGARAAPEDGAGPGRSGGRARKAVGQRGLCCGLGAGSGGVAQRAAQQALVAGRPSWGGRICVAEAKAALGRADPAGQAQSVGLWSIRSPVNGRVLKLPLESTAPVSPGQTLMELGDVSALEAVIDVLSNEVVGVQSGRRCSFTGRRQCAFGRAG